MSTLRDGSGNGNNANGEDNVTGAMAQGSLVADPLDMVIDKLLRYEIEFEIEIEHYTILYGIGIELNWN